MVGTLGLIGVLKVAGITVFVGRFEYIGNKMLDDALGKKSTNPSPLLNKALKKKVRWP
jgi:hypothetical protein